MDVISNVNASFDGTGIPSKSWETDDLAIDLKDYSTFFGTPQFSVIDADTVYVSGDALSGYTTSSIITLSSGSATSDIETPIEVKIRVPFIYNGTTFYQEPYGVDVVLKITNDAPYNLTSGTVAAGTEDTDYSFEVTAGAVVILTALNPMLISCFSLLDKNGSISLYISLL